MPNHVTHRVVVSGEPAHVAAFKQRCIREVSAYDEHTKKTNAWTTFDFNALIPMPEFLKGSQSSSVVDMGLAILGKSIPTGYGSTNPSLDEMLTRPWVVAANIRTASDLKAHLLREFPNCVALAERALEAYQQCGHTDWYGWSNENWGTKWPAYSFSLVDDQPGRLEFKFDTAWATPAPIWDKVAEDFPDLRFDIDAFDEGWGFAVTGAIDHGKMALVLDDNPNPDQYEKVYGEKYEPED